jgi:PIN domain nuclease of toxin-antitoxin system
LRALLDTHALLWWLSDDPGLTRTARKTVAETRNALIVSAASAWEIATKVRLGKLPSAADLVSNFSEQIEREGFQWMAISATHGIRAGLLPGPHKDPFDRMLIAQSQAENIPIISNETIFS